MSTISYTAGDVMDTVAALLNDVNKQLLTYSAQLPYLQQSFRELREELQVNNVPVTTVKEEILSLVAGTTEVSFVTSPGLPSDLIEIRQLWERQAGVDPWIPMTRMETLPYSLEGQDSQNFLIWSWADNKINLLAASQDNDLKMDYIKELTGIVDQNTVIAVINGRTFLEFRTAAKCARYINEDPEKSDAFNTDAQLALDRLNIVESKAKQTIFIRRRPFRQTWKTRGVYY